MINRFSSTSEKDNLSIYMDELDDTNINRIIEFLTSNVDSHNAEMWIHTDSDGRRKYNFQSTIRSEESDEEYRERLIQSMDRKLEQVNRDLNTVREIEEQINSL